MAERILAFSAWNERCLLCLQVPVEIGKLPVIELFNIEENKACKAPPPEVYASKYGVHHQRPRSAPSSAASGICWASCGDVFNPTRSFR